MVLLHFLLELVQLLTNTNNYVYMFPIKNLFMKTVYCFMKMFKNQDEPINYGTFYNWSIVYAMLILLDGFIH